MEVERVLKRIFKLSLRLYPPGFRREYGQEMEGVFAQALEEAGGRRRAGMRLFGRELMNLPGRLLQEHWDSWRGKEAGMHTGMAPNDRFNQPDPSPRMGWGGFIMAVLPYILIWIIDALPRILVMADLLPAEVETSHVMSALLMISGGGTMLVVLVYAWRRGWPRWWASWTLFYGLLLVFLLSQLARLITAYRIDSLLQDGSLYLGIPLIIAFTLYWETRTDRLRGVLAALPALYLLWLPQMEFVPDGLEYAIKTASTMLIVMAALMIVRSRNWRAGFWIALGVNVLVGLQYSYAGIYHGGALPSTAPGPNPLEVIKNFVPGYLVSGSILLGPLLARLFRDIGLRSGLVGRLSYHIALGSLLVIMAANLTGLMLGTSNDIRNAHLFYTLLSWSLYAALGAYALGVLFLYRSARRSEAQPGLVEKGLLALLPLGLPLTFATPFITWRWPASRLFGVPWMWALPDGVTLALGGLWLGLAVWLVTRGRRLGGSYAAVPQPG